MVVANGDRLTSPGRCCRQLRIAVVTEVFVGDCFGLALGSCDMVLGVQWLEPLVPILWAFGTQTVAFVHNGHKLL
jgi:hypothetical protein